MKHKLSIVSRILVAFASGSLIAAFFLPVWRIDLFAPQYPEGLTMNIWVNKLTGDVDIINGLNHYIGMKHITADMFPEFIYLPIVVGFFIIFGLMVSITGNRKLLLAYLALTLIGGALAMIDFYQWGYDYGHNLDPKAPIQVPGLSYQPPLLGHKRLLNFDAYSFPHIGGWVVIGAGFLAFAVYAFEWFKLRKLSRSTGKFALALSLCLALFMISCNTEPESFTAGKDNCDFCKMGISDTRFGGEIITTKGKIYKFDDLGCLASFIEGSELANQKISRTLTINFEKPNTFLDVESASFVQSSSLKTPMGSNAAGFASKDKAEAANKNMNGVVLNWDALAPKIK